MPNRVGIKTGDAFRDDRIVPPGLDCQTACSDTAMRTMEPRAKAQKNKK